MASRRSLGQNPRAVAAQALARAAAGFPDLEPSSLDTAGLSPADVRLALAIQRTALQRWLTIEHLLDQHLRQPMHALEPALRGLLLSAGVQVLFMDRLPQHAVVNESVQVAKVLVRPGASGLVNAVLRRLAESVLQVVVDQAWTPAADRLPLALGAAGGFVALRENWLPDPKRTAAHLSLATSHPEPLVERWVKALGPEQAATACLHGVATPPTIVAGAVPDASEEFRDHLRAHAQAGFAVWDGPQEKLKRWLAGGAGRRVQDPSAAAAVAAVAHLAPVNVLDLCAGRGTKTRQLAAQFPGAKILASDPDPGRLADLKVLAGQVPAIQVLLPQEVAALPAGAVDLLVLDVPCSNTGVLGRRPEARYRFTRRALRSLMMAQRRIVAGALPRLAPEGHLLYSTCSLEPEENCYQMAWMSDEFGLHPVSERLLLPSGPGPAEQHHDGGYHALMRARAVGK